MAFTDGPAGEKATEPVVEEGISYSLEMVLQAEERARNTLEKYRRSAEEIISSARRRAEQLISERLEEARREAERELARKVAVSRQEAEELRWEYMFDRARLLAEVSSRRRKAIELILRRLEEKGKLEEE